MNETIQKNAAEFFSKRLEDKQNRELRTPCREKTIQQLMSENPVIPKEVIDGYLSRNKSIDATSQALLEIRKSLHKIRNTINGYPPQKRFFICETIDFFNSPAYIGKVVPALLDPAKIENRYQLLQFIYLAYSRLKNNIEIIISNPQLFSKKNLHVERGGLYTLSTDVARNISGLFSDEFLSGFKESASDVARVSAILKPFRIKGASVNTVAIQNLLNGFLPHPVRFTDAYLDFISVIQTHDLLYLYSQKRHVYYKQFLISIAAGSKMAEPFVSSIVLAGCLLSNSQLTPGKQLTDLMVSENDFSSEKTGKLLVEYVNSLTPSTVLGVIEDFKASVGDVIAGKIRRKQTDPGGLLNKSRKNLGSVRSLIRQRFKI